MCVCVCEVCICVCVHHFVCMCALLYVCVYMCVCVIQGWVQMVHSLTSFQNFLPLLLRQGSCEVVFEFEILYGSFQLALEGSFDSTVASFF